MRLERPRMGSRAEVASDGEAKLVLLLLCLPFGFRPVTRGDGSLVLALVRVQHQQWCWRW